MAIAGRVDTVAQSEADASRWLQLLIGIVCMAMIANLQYGWTLLSLEVLLRWKIHP